MCDRINGRGLNTRSEAPASATVALAAVAWSVAIGAEAAQRQGRKRIYGRSRP